MICAIMQPTYLSWLGYYALLDNVDHFVLLDDVQVCSRSWGVRNRIKTATGVAMLTVPLKKMRPREQRFFVNTEPDYGQPWVRKHLQTVAQAYKKAPYFEEVFSDFENFLSHRHETIGVLNEKIVRGFGANLGICSKVMCSSSMPASACKKDARLVEICETIGVGTYIAAPGSADYIESENISGAFQTSTVQLRYQEYVHPVYPQQPGPFVSHLSIVDLLMNCGYNWSLSILRSGQRPPISSYEMRQRSIDVLTGFHGRERT